MSEQAGSVQLAYIYRDEVSHSWHESMWEMFAHDRAGAGYLREKRLNIRTHPIRMVQSRNAVATAFLDATDAEWLFWVDTDMGWRADALDRLMAAADPVKAPVVGGLCFGLYPSGRDEMGGLRFRVTPTMYQFAQRVEDGQTVLSPMPSYPQDTVTQVNATGSAFLLIHRTVLEKVRAEYGDHWYDQSVDAVGDVLGEDFSFCLRAQRIGAPIWVDTGTPTSHHKSLWITEDDYWLAKEDEQRVKPAPELPIFTHLPASVAALAKNEHDRDDMLKLPQDLERYAAIIEATKPDVIIETGTRTGGSARWFADHGVDVITVDVHAVTFPISYRDRITMVEGDSIDANTVASIADLVAGWRVMVTLDSDHSAAHVRREIEAYGPLVSPGCYLVVEDTIFGYGGDDLKAQHGMADVQGSPLDAVVSHLHLNPAWSRDVAIEQTHPVGANPAGWWVRNG